MMTMQQAISYYSWMLVGVFMMIYLVGANDITSAIDPRSIHNTARFAESSTNTTYCSCQSCTSTVWNTPAGEYTCGERISYLYTQVAASYPSQESACRRIAGLEFPNQCGACDPRSCDDKVYTGCGCESCTEEILQRQAGDFTCQERISWIQLNDVTVNNSEEAACRKVSNEYSTICGPQCNPDQCPPSAPVPSPVMNPTSNSDYDQILYCFPPKDNRTRYRNVWNNHTVEVKEDVNVCGPGDTKFSSSTVIVPRRRKQVRLLYKIVNGVWTGSELRVVPSPLEPFSYGTYRFSISRVAWRRNRQRFANELPPSLVLGLFSWDPTDDYAIKENYNREVDIEISRWNDVNATASDGQFLVQPPGSPQMKRFHTGINGRRRPGGNIYEFTWLPGVVQWNTTAGGGQSHSYSTKQAITLGLNDYVQCLPANVEIRMNLWNTLGTQQPTAMKPRDVVEVVIDNFEYIPSRQIGVRNGNYCSKDCQCLPTSFCSNTSFCRPQRSA
jgi:hypothetical protein